MDILYRMCNSICRSTRGVRTTQHSGDGLGAFVTNSLDTLTGTNHSVEIVWSWRLENQRAMIGNLGSPYRFFNRNSRHKRALQQR